MHINKMRQIQKKCTHEELKFSLNLLCKEGSPTHGVNMVQHRPWTLCALHALLTLHTFYTMYTLCASFHYKAPIVHIVLICSSQCAPNRYAWNWIPSNEWALQHLLNSMKDSLPFPFVSIPCLQAAVTVPYLWTSMCFSDFQSWEELPA